jgi:F-type H+-transporting ATPase subunit delta
LATRIHTEPVATVYAQALLDAAGAKAGEVGEQLEEFLATWREASDLRTFLESPALEPSVKKSVLESLRGRFDDTLVNFLCILVDKGRVAHLEQIGAAYRDLADAAAQRVRVHVTSATPLAAEQRARLDETLKQKLGRDVVLETEVEPELLAGMIIRVGDRIYEGTVRNWLQRMRRDMVRSSGYED